MKRLKHSKPVKQHQRHRAFFILRAAALGCCGLMSAFLLMSGYESVFSRSLPLVHTLAGVNLDAFNKVYSLPKAAQYPSGYYGNFGKPETLKLPTRSLRLNIAPAIQQGPTWLARANTLHLLIPQPPRDGNIGVTFLYCRAGFRTLNDQNLPNAGDNLFIDTDTSWRYVFKVLNAKLYPESQPYVPADSGSTSKLLIDCNDAGQHVNVIIEATLLSVQGVIQ